MSTPENDRIVATIAAQMGGMRRLQIMVGAHRFVTNGERDLGFWFKGSPLYNFVRVQLMGDDTYTMTFYKVIGVRREPKSTIVDRVFAEQLLEVFQMHTGLYLTL